MSEEPADVNNPEIPEYLGPPSPAHQEVAKRIGDSPKLQREIANALFQTESHTHVRLTKTMAERDKLKFDELTNVLNRGPGEEQAEKLVAEVINGGPDVPTAVMLIMVDVKNLHGINEAHGHHVGDVAITDTAEKAKEVADHLRSRLRTHDRRGSLSEHDSEEQRETDRRRNQYKDIVYRFGGDEFVVVLPIYESEAFTKADVKDIIDERIHDPEKLRYGSAFYDPISNPGVEPKDVIKNLKEQADPKGKGESTRGSKAA